MSSLTLERERGLFTHASPREASPQTREWPKRSRTSDLLAPATITPGYLRCLEGSTQPYEAVVAGVLENAASAGAEIFIAGGSYTLEYVLGRRVISPEKRVLPRETYLSCTGYIFGIAQLYFDQSCQAEKSYLEDLLRIFPEKADDIKKFFRIARGINIARVEHLAERLSMLINAPDPEVLVRSQKLDSLEAGLRESFSIPNGLEERVIPHPFRPERQIVIRIGHKEMIHGHDGMELSIFERLTSLRGISGAYLNMIYRVTFQEFPSDEDRVGFDALFGQGASILRRLSLAKLTRQEGRFKWTPSRELLREGEVLTFLPIAGQEQPVYSLDFEALGNTPIFRVAHLFTLPWQMAHLGAVQDPDTDWTRVQNWSRPKMLTYYLQFHQDHFAHRLGDGGEYGTKVAQKRLDNAARMLLSAIALDPQLALATIMPWEIYDRFSQEFRRDLALKGLLVPVGTIHLLTEKVDVNDRTVEMIEDDLRQLATIPKERYLDEGLKVFFRTLDALRLVGYDEPSSLIRFFDVWQHALLEKSGYQSSYRSAGAALSSLQGSTNKLIMNMKGVFEGACEDSRKTLSMLTKDDIPYLDLDILLIDLRLVLQAADREERMKRFL